MIGICIGFATMIGIMVLMILDSFNPALLPSWLVDSIHRGA